jgi:hypothetical protein
MTGALYSFAEVREILTEGAGLIHKEYSTAQLLAAAAAKWQKDAPLTAAMELAHLIVSRGAISHYFDRVMRYIGFSISIAREDIEANALACHFGWPLKSRRGRVRMFFCNEPPTESSHYVRLLIRHMGASAQPGSHSSEAASNSIARHSADRLTSNDRAQRLRLAELQEVCDEGAFMLQRTRCIAGQRITFQMGLSVLRSVRACKQYLVFRDLKGVSSGYAAWIWTSDIFAWEQRPNLLGWHSSEMNCGQTLVLAEIYVQKEHDILPALLRLASFGFKAKQFTVANLSIGDKRYHGRPLQLFPSVVSEDTLRLAFRALGYNPK